ncbi:hypothetical protein ACHAWF_018950 [Thalassiosira exigua]
MYLRGKLAKLIILIKPELYRKYITYTSNGVSIIYVLMNKAMDGLHTSALGFYKKLVKDLKVYGFKTNPYDPCVANMSVDGDQHTVLWHVDDLKCSHNDPKVNTMLVVYCVLIYWETVMVHRGKVRDYLGVNFDYGTQKRKVEIFMIDCLHNLPEYFKKIEELGAPTATPVVEQLFQVWDEADRNYAPLPEEKAVVFHRFTAKLLFMSNRARCDVQTAVSYMTSRVKKPDLDNWGKQRRCLKYLKGMKQMKLTFLSGIISGKDKEPSCSDSLKPNQLLWHHPWSVLDDTHKQGKIWAKTEGQQEHRYIPSTQVK